jgi:hypothetical protein
MALTRWFDRVRTLARTEHRLAWSIALAADALQIGLFPLFAAGGLSPATTLVDLITAFLLTRILGWHWAFLPSFALEMLPGFDLFPTWTAAVLFVTGKEARNTDEPEILPPDHARVR